MNPDGFLRDVLAAPLRLATVLDAYEGQASPLLPLAGPLGDARRILFLGMGSSRFAAETVAARLRSQGVDAVAELASTGAPAAPRRDTLVVGISASGSTPETVDAFLRHRGSGVLVAITNQPEASLGQAADHVLPLLAGVEEGGVSCLTYQATLAVLFRLAGVSGDRLRPAVEAAATLRDTRHRWLDELVTLFERASTVYTIAPAERMSSALQSALMFREGPRRPAAATETGDWLHVDVYLSKRPGYAAILFPGSRFDSAVVDWLTRRSARFVSVGRSSAGADAVVPFPHADDPLVQCLAETGVAEIVAAELWRRGIAAGDEVLLDPS